MKAVVTGVDNYRWVDDDGLIQEAAKGAEIDVSEKEFERAQKMSADGALEQPALAKPGSAEAKAALADDGSDTAEAADFPDTHDELDALADANDVEWSKARLNVAEKQAELQAAGVAAPAPPAE